MNDLTLARKVLIYSLLLATTYVATGKLGLMLALPPGYASAIFPPAGIAIAAAFVADRKALPAIFIGSFILNIWVGYESQQQINTLSVEIGLLIAAGSVIQALIGGWWLHRQLQYPTTLDSPKDVIVFFISAPLICLINATVSVSGLFMLGLIGDSLFFSSWASWWIGDSLGLIVMFPLTLVVLGRPRNVWKKRMLTMAFPMVITFALLVIIFVMVNRWERKDSLLEFHSMSNQLSEQLRLRFEAQDAVLHQLSSLFSYRNLDKVSRQDFHNFVKETLQSNPVIYAIEWLPKINGFDRESFVNFQRKEFGEFDIKELGNNGALVHAVKRQFYYPITYIEPLNESTRAIAGFDIASIAERKLTIFKAIKENVAVSTPPTKLVVHYKNEPGLILMYPVNGNGQDGVVATVFRIDNFIGELLNPLSNQLDFRLVDIETNHTLYEKFSSKHAKVEYSRLFEFGTRHYRLDTAPTELYFQQHRGWQSWGMLAIGIFGTGLMGALLLLGTGYTARIESLVDEKASELKESFSRFQEITSTLGEGIYVMNLDGVVTFTNPKAQFLLGRTEQELLGKDAHLLFHNKRIDHSPYPADECEMRNVMQSGTPYKSTEEVFWRKDGTPIYITVNSVPLFRDEKIVGAVVVFDDISDRKRIEHALHASERSFREIIEYAPIGMTIVSLEGKFIRVNKTLCNIVGYTNDELINLTFQEITHPDDLLIDLEHFHQLLDGKTNTYQMEKRYIRKDQKIVWVQLSVSLFRDDDGLPQYFISQIEDITERKLRHDEVHQHAYFDTLTGLPNRRMLMNKLHQDLSQAERKKTPLALFFLDLDHFKHINDSLGHDVGDLILKEASARLSSCLRAHDTVSRLGGDEFVIILTDISTEFDAQLVAEKILKEFQHPIEINNHQLTIGTSIGIAMRRGDMQISVKDLMKHADAAMYESKAAGRNRYQFYNA